MDKERFKQLYQLAHGGDMNAKADLWLEFEFAFDHDPLPDFMRDNVDDASSFVPESAPSSNFQLQTSNCNAEGGAPC